MKSTSVSKSILGPAAPPANRHSDGRRSGPGPGRRSVPGPLQTHESPPAQAQGRANTTQVRARGGPSPGKVPGALAPDNTRVCERCELGEVLPEVVLKVTVSLISKANWEEAWACVERARGCRGVRLNQRVFNALIAACIRDGRLDKAEEALGLMRDAGLAPDAFSGSSLIVAYGKDGQLRKARSMFDSVPVQLRDEGFYKAMIGTYCSHGKTAAAREVLDLLVADGHEPGAAACFLVLQAHGKDGQIGKAREVFRMTPARCRDVNFYNAMIHFCGALGDAAGAQEFFDLMGRNKVVPNDISRSSLVTAYGNSRQPQTARKVFESFRRQSRESNLYTAMISVYGNLGQAGKAQDVYNLMREDKVDPEPIVESALITAYGNAGQCEQARRFFNSIPVARRIANHYNAMMAAYARVGRTEDAKAMFALMSADGIEPDDVSHLTLTKALKESGRADEAQARFESVAPAGRTTEMYRKQIALAGHSGRALLAQEIFDRMVAAGIEPDDKTQAALITAYGQCGLPDHARRVFDSGRDGFRSADPYNAMIRACGDNARVHEARQVHGLMRDDGIAPDALTVHGLLNAYGDAGLVDSAREVFESLGRPMRRPAHYTDMLLIYGNAGRVKEAQVVFDLMKEDGVPIDAIAHTALVKAYAAAGQFGQARRKFDDTPLELRDLGVYCQMMKACGDAGRAREAQEIFDRMVDDGFVPDIIARTTLARAFAEAGRLEKARTMFDAIPPGQRNVAACNQMIVSYGKAKRAAQARQIFASMADFGVVPERSTYLALAWAQANAGELDRARETFDAMPPAMRGPAAYLRMMAIYADAGQPAKVRELHDLMRGAGEVPSVAARLALVRACGVAGEFEQARDEFDTIPIGMRGDEAYAVLIEACGSRIGQAREIFDQIRDDGFEPGIRAHSALIGAYGKAGRRDMAREHLYAMPRGLLHAKVFDQVIGFYSDAGRAREAREIFERMSGHGIEPSDSSFAALIAAHGKAGDVRKAREAFDAFRTRIRTPAPYDAMMTVYRDAGMAAKVEEIIGLMLDDGLEPPPASQAPLAPARAEENMPQAAATEPEMDAAEAIASLRKADLSMARARLDAFRARSYPDRVNDVCGTVAMLEKISQGTREVDRDDVFLAMADDWQAALGELLQLIAVETPDQAWNVKALVSAVAALGRLSRPATADLLSQAQVKEAVQVVLAGIEKAVAARPGEWTDDLAADFVQALRRLREGGFVPDAKPAARLFDGEPRRVSAELTNAVGHSQPSDETLGRLSVALRHCNYLHEIMHVVSAHDTPALMAFLATLEAFPQARRELAIMVLAQHVRSGRPLSPHEQQQIARSLDAADDWDAWPAPLREIRVLVLEETARSDASANLLSALERLL